MITSIVNSQSLAALLNESTPATAEDAAETPLDWTGGLWLAGDTYEVDATATTTIRLVLANGSAAITFKPAGRDCWGPDNPCGHAPGKPGLREQAHWVPADTSEWTCTHDACGVTRDWRTVTVWDANGFSDATVHATLKEAQQDETKRCAELTQMCAELHTDDADDEN